MKAAAKAKTPSLERKECPSQWVTVPPKHKTSPRVTFPPAGAVNAQSRPGKRVTCAGTAMSDLAREGLAFGA
eukprot:13519923-Heterocapsa_arctica.AAC.1